MGKWKQEVGRFVWVPWLNSSTELHGGVVYHTVGHYQRAGIKQEH